MQPISVPSIPAQPDKATYSTDELALFKRYTRALFYSAFGVQPEPFDVGRDAKDWFDTTSDLSDPININLYKSLGRNGKGEPVIRQMMLKASIAASLNLPNDGAQSYPAYVVAPTTAKRLGPGELTSQPVNPMFLSSKAEAITLNAEVGGSSIMDQQSMGGGFSISYNTETRRLWEINFNGRNTNVGLLLTQKNSHGVGAPGHWDLSQPEPVWVFDPAVVGDVSAPHNWTPMPLRDLLPNEVLRSTLDGSEVVRTDKEAELQANPSMGASKGGGLTLIEHGWLQGVYNKVMGV